MPFSRDSSSDQLIPSRTTCIVGGGSSAHVLVPFLSEAGHHVHLLTRRPNDWHDIIFSELTEGDNGRIVATHCGKIDKISDDPAEVIPDSDFIILCMPVGSYRPALAKIGPHINRDKEVFVGTVFGQAGFNWMVHEMEKDFHLENVVTFAIGQIPWICRSIEYGQSCANYGGKIVNTVAVSPADRFDKLNHDLLEDISLRPLGIGAFRQAGFLSITLSVDNQIIHPSRCYGLWNISGGSWDNEAAVPMFYRDFDKGSAENIRKLDADYEKIRQAIRERFPDRAFTYMMSYMDLEKLNHNSSHPDILASFRHSKQLASIKTPTLVGPHGTRTLNTKCRFFTDDIPYGLLVAKWIAEQLYVHVPFIDEIILWAQNLRNEQFLTPEGHINRNYCLKGKFTCGIPESYGFIKLEDILEAPIKEE